METLKRWRQALSLPVLLVLLFMAAGLCLILLSSPLGWLLQTSPDRLASLGFAVSLYGGGLVVAGQLVFVLVVLLASALS